MSKSDRSSGSNGSGGSTRRKGRLAASICALLCGAAMVAGTSDANAFTISSALTEGCHEQISESALRVIRGALGTAPAIPPDDNEKALIDDLPFDVPSDMRELAAASFLVGIRDNDLKGRAPTAIDQLATVHGNPNNQEEHCLRAAADDEPNGTAITVGKCQTFIHDRAMQAVDALAPDGSPDPNARTDIDVALSIRGTVTASLPTFWVRMGQATHAIQDSFAHAYRTSDGMQITQSLNWIDLVNEDEVESRDGPVHKSELDKCNAGDAIRNRNKALATAASVDLLEAVLNPSLTRDQKSDKVNAVLSTYLTVSPGCTYDNAWCNAPENTYTNASACGCALVGGDGGGPTTGFMLGLAGVAAIVFLRRRKLARASAAVLSLALLLSSGQARAQVEVEAGTAPAPAPTTQPGTPAVTQAGTTPVPGADAPIPPRTNAEVTQATKETEHQSRFALAANVGGSVVDAGLAQSLGARVRLSDLFVIGLDGEINEWYGVNDRRFDVGAVNVYATGILRIPMRFQPISLRTTAQLGGSYELLDLYGVPKGSVGLFAGIYPLGLEWKMSGRAYLLFDPLGVAIPVPHLTGAPFAYPQFRSQLGIEFSL
jgi:MYXO-CTERM domain-containing protein